MPLFLRKWTLKRQNLTDSFLPLCNALKANFSKLFGNFNYKIFYPNVFALLKDIDTFLTTTHFSTTTNIYGKMFRSLVERSQIWIRFKEDMLNINTSL